jgi:hypothetical protein
MWSILRGIAPVIISDASTLKSSEKFKKEQGLQYILEDYGQ